MSYLRKVKATCGRYAERPNEKDENVQVNYEDETSIPLQDQIDNLKAKISLKEKYNKALKEELSESHAGAATMIFDLVLENQQLEEELQNELNAEKQAVKKALRSYRHLQLAMTNKDAEYVINWLDDKIFDASKTLNEGIYLLKQMQNKIQDAEGQVRYLEMCPVPGSEKWEREAEEDRVHLESAIENRKANRDAASILNKKYREILYTLKGEKGKWPHVMATMERNLNQLNNELSSLEDMLVDAVRFREEAHEKLKLTEQEASANRKQRRMQMNKMKKSVEKALDANTAKYHRTVEPNASNAGAPTNAGPPSQASLQKGYQEIKAKQTEVEEYEDTVEKLVQAMRVPDLRQCPRRLNSVRKVAENLSNSLAMKEDLRNLLLRHKYRMKLIFAFFKYSGCEKEEIFKRKLAEKERLLKELEADIAMKEWERNEDGQILLNLRCSLISLDEVLNQGRRKPAPPSKNEDLNEIMRRTVDKISRLVESVESLKNEMPSDLETERKSGRQQRSYAPYIKFNLAPRHVRVGAPDEIEFEDNSDPELDIPDSKIPGREELKRKSEWFYGQALLKRGIRDVDMEDG